ncbi:5-oxoprolinase [Thermocladium modestius]|uniref:5-oxoprolinase n=1 Tax=Thermocladium modestius TaxID=62609 RepID=A0A830GTG4_9CREN|nr:hydantoinase B/oxoprolinase family protein [Thermocladium modestius]GGP19115.1 5-oxoprolinase [Thermocladium modestius]
MDRFTSQIMRSSLFYASEEMGIVLRNSAYSPNIKERMDHSAAIFDAEGRMLAQAEHIPVHLGSLPWGLKNTVEYMRREGVEFEEGSMVVVNNPYIAGTHLNDVTVIRPIYFSGRLVAFAANKAHHSDVGGKVPGSISFDARSIYEEGLIINPVLLMRRNEFQRDVISLFASNSRNPYERMGDIKAQAAANLTGERRVLEVIGKYGLQSFLEANEEAFRYAETMFIKRLESVPRGAYEAVDYLEKPGGGDIRLAVKVVIGEDKVLVDYEGTDPQVPMPLNAVLGVTISGVHFVFRTLLGEDVPLNHGAFSRLEVRAPEGSVLNPTFPAPVAGGNVETSQRNADLLYLAMSKAMPREVPAAAGGSMNNVMMGGVHEGRTWAFYETIGVGLGGRDGMDGVDGIHANMTNTMNTPIEEIERSLPLLVKRYEFRPNSSGPGRFRGGSGIVRSYMVRTGRVTVTVLADRGRHGPWGLMGGGPGATTEVIVGRRGRRVKVDTKVTVELEAGDYLEIRTAGGGGYGDPMQRDPEAVRRDLENGLITESYAKKHYGWSK